jgi:hypothetical protein
MGKKRVQSLMWFLQSPVDGWTVSRKVKIGIWQGPVDK